jgi:hypothetical protein
MHITHAFGRREGRWRLTATALAFALCATIALAIGGTAPASAAGKTRFSADRTDNFMCPVHTTAQGRIKRVYLPTGGYTKSLQVTTQTTTGYNGYIFAACRAWVYVNVISDTDEIMGTLTYAPWAGPLSTHDEAWGPDTVDLDDEDIDHVERLEIHQTHRET